LNVFNKKNARAPFEHVQVTLVTVDEPPGGV